MFVERGMALARTRENPLLVARLTHARAKLEFARQRPEPAVECFVQTRALIEPLGMPYELALTELAHGQVLRRDGGASRRRGRC